MESTFVKKRQMKDGPSPAAPLTQQGVQRQLAWAADAEQFQNRDPMFHITENFMRSFDAMGSMQQQRAAGMIESVPGLTDFLGKIIGQDEEFNQQETKMTESDIFDPGGDDGAKALYRQSRMNEEFEENKHGQGRLMNKFTDMTFMRGKMSAAVLRGTGNMMLFSCLKRTLGQSQPYKLQQRKLFQGGSRGWKPRNTKASDAQSTTLLRNEVFADSAVGLVFNVTKDARRTVEQMAELIENGGTGTETWERMMPFLSFQKEEALLDEYRSRLDNLGNGPGTEKQRAVLTKAMTRTQTMLAKKKQMRNEFMFKLRAIGGQAKQAAITFSNEEFQETLKYMLTHETAYPEPPEGPPPPEDEMPPDGVWEDDLETDEPVMGDAAPNLEAEPPVGGEA